MIYTKTFSDKDSRFDVWTIDGSTYFLFRHGQTSSASTCMGSLEDVARDFPEALASAAQVGNAYDLWAMKMQRAASYVAVNGAYRAVGCIR